jgi:hypothetical protein
MKYHAWNAPHGDQLSRETIELTGAQFVRLTVARDISISVRAGTAWITQDGDRNDNVVRAGESFVINRSGLALVTPIPEATVVIAALPAQARTSLIERIHLDGQRYPFLCARPHPVLGPRLSPTF